MRRAGTKARSYQVLMEAQVLVEGHVQRGKIAATAVQITCAAYLWGQVDVCHAQPLSLSGWDIGPGWGWCAPSLRVGVAYGETAQHAAPTKPDQKSACVSTCFSHHNNRRNCQPSEQDRYNIARFSYSRQRMTLTTDHMLLRNDYICM